MFRKNNYPMKNDKFYSPPFLKIYGLKVFSKNINDKNKNLSNMTITEKDTKKNIGRNFINFRKNGLKEKSEDFSERNKSALMAKYRNIYSMKYYNNQIKSIERNMGIEYNKDNKENTQINYLNIKKINLPLNHIKISFDLFNNNNLKNKRNYNNMTYLNLSKEKQIISTFNSKSKRNKINIKSSPQIFHQYSNNDFSKLQIDKDRLQKISQSIKYKID